jgi:hypothetical protein
MALTRWGCTGVATLGSKCVIRPAHDMDKSLPCMANCQIEAG